MSAAPVPLVVLKSPDYERWAEQHEGRLPYGIERLNSAGFELRTTDATFRKPFTSRPIATVIRWFERVGTPFAQTLLLSRDIVRSPATLAMFESEGHFLALVRSINPIRSDRRLVIVACWLAEIAPNLTPRKRAVYRWIYQRVDSVIVFSSNQVSILESALGIPPARVHVVPFGIDIEPLRPAASSCAGPIVSVGRDAGRDWQTLFDAVAGTGWDVRIATRPRMLHATPPTEVRMLGYLDRTAYIDLLTRASVVVVTTHDMAYPSGQTVLLEAMALGKACVVTETAALADYVEDGVDCLAVPTGDARAVRRAIERLVDDSDLRSRIGQAARARVEERHTAATMWDNVASVITATQPAKRRLAPVDDDANRPLIAVIIPTLDRSDLVVRAVRSVLAQTFTRFEIVVVDDGSSEDVVGAVARSCDDERVRVIRRFHGGVSRARNSGVAASTAPFVTFLDSDDEAHPDWLSTMASAVRRGVDLYFVGCTYLYDDGSTATIEPRDLGPGYGAVVGTYLAGTYIVRREMLDEVSGFRPGLRLGENGDLGMRIGAWSRSNELRTDWTSDSLTTVHIRERVYDPALNFEAVHAVLPDLPALLENDPSLLATHYAIAGVAASRLGRQREARRLLSRAVRHDPRNWRHSARWLRTFLGGAPWVGARQDSAAPRL